MTKSSEVKQLSTKSSGEDRLSVWEDCGRRVLDETQDYIVKVLTIKLNLGFDYEYKELIYKWVQMLYIVPTWLWLGWDQCWDHAGECAQCCRCSPRVSECWESSCAGTIAKWGEILTGLLKDFRSWGSTSVDSKS